MLTGLVYHKQTQKATGRWDFLEKKGHGSPILSLISQKKCGTMDKNGEMWILR